MQRLDPLAPDRLVPPGRAGLDRVAKNRRALGRLLLDLVLALQLIWPDRDLAIPDCLYGWVILPADRGRRLQGTRLAVMLRLVCAPGLLGLVLARLPTARCWPGDRGRRWLDFLGGRAGMSCDEPGRVGASRPAA